MKKIRIPQEITINISKLFSPTTVILVILSVFFIVSVFWIKNLSIKVESLELKVGALKLDNSNLLATNSVNNDPSGKRLNSVSVSNTSSPSKKSSSNSNAKNEIKVEKDDYIRGNLSARIALIEYSDLECPYCKQFHPTVKTLLEIYKDDLMWVYRHFPLDAIHSKARKEAEAVECAGKLGGNESFWNLIDKIFEVTPSNNKLDLKTLSDLAESVGIDKNKFEKCLNSGEMAGNVIVDVQTGTALGVTGTPGNILLDTKTGQTRLIPGALPLEQMKQAVSAMLSE